MTGPVKHRDLTEGRPYTAGSSFRARAEAHARRFRVAQLQVGCGKYGHWLEPRAAERGANFLHPVVFDAVKARAAKGKGVNLQRTCENMLASQALCFNLFAPLASTASRLGLAGTLLAPFVPGLTRVRGIELEYTPPYELFRDQSGRGGVDCDVLIEFESDRGEPGVLVIEMKFVEDDFSACGHRSKGQCPTDVQIGSDFSGCRYVSRNRYAYWQRAAESGSLSLSLVTSCGCPFGESLWQLWVNHTLAYAESKRRGASRAVFAVCASESNESLDARTRVKQYSAHVTDRGSVVFIPLEQLIERLVTSCGSDADLARWADLMRRRYVVPPRGVSMDPG